MCRGLAILLSLGLSLTTVSLCLAPVACYHSGGSSPAAPAAPAPGFTEVTAAAGIDHMHGYYVLDNDLILMAGGAAAADYDNDGWLDLYVVCGDLDTNKLYRNRGDGSFEEVAEQAGVNVFGRGCGPTFADVDGDGWVDLFVGGVDGAVCQLLRNNGDGTFSNTTTDSGLIMENQNSTFSASFGDFDRDGDLDLFTTHWGASYADGSTPQHLWRNLGGFIFEELPLAGVLEGVDDFTFTANIDDDLWPDLLVASDFATSRVLRNRGDGSFENVTGDAITDENGMGAAVAATTTMGTSTGSYRASTARRSSPMAGGAPRAIASTATRGTAPSWMPPTTPECARGAGGGPPPSPTSTTMGTWISST